MNARLAYPRTLPGSVVSACHLAVALESGLAHRLLRRLPTDPGRHRGGARNAAVALLVCPTVAASASHACRAKSARHSLRIVLVHRIFFCGTTRTAVINTHVVPHGDPGQVGGRPRVCLAARLFTRHATRPAVRSSLCVTCHLTAPTLCHTCSRRVVCL